MPYLFAGAVIVALLGALYGLYERSQRAEVESFYVTENTALKASNSILAGNVDTLTRVNEANARNVAAMLAQQVEDSKIINHLASERQSLQMELEDVRAQLRDVETNDEEARRYLNERIPAGVLPYVNRPAAAGHGG